MPGLVITPDRDPWAPQALVFRFALNLAGLFLANALVPGIEIEGWEALLGGAAIFALVNILLRPLATFFAFCLIVFTFGLFVLVINTALLGATAWVAGQLDLAFTIDGFWSAFFGALVISAVSIVASLVTRGRVVR